MATFSSSLVLNGAKVRRMGTMQLEAHSLPCVFILLGLSWSDEDGYGAIGVSSSFSSRMKPCFALRVDGASTMMVVVLGVQVPLHRVSIGLSLALLTVTPSGT